MSEFKRTPINFDANKHQLKGKTWPEKRAELEGILEDFLMKVHSLARPDGVPIGYVNMNDPFLIEANRLIDSLEKGYHSKGITLVIPDGAKDDYS